MAFDLFPSIEPNSAILQFCNSEVSVTAFFQMDSTDVGRPIEGAAQAKLSEVVGQDQVNFINAAKRALDLCGDTIAVNIMLVGYSFRKGFVPISLDTIDQTIKLNGIVIPFVRGAFTLGRILANNPSST